MAKLSARFDLCRLIDLKSLVGVSEDSTPGCVIVTLGRNIVIRFKVSDQKQESSWSSKDKLSAPVVFDNNLEHYVGVFNGNQIRLWNQSTEQLDKIKKYKFHKEIFGVITQNVLKLSTVVVFRDGSVLPLSVALENRKCLPTFVPVLSSSQVIDYAELLSLWNHEFVVLHTTKDESITCLELIPLLPETLSHVSLELVHPENEKIKLVGHCVHALDTCQLITLWSDGKIFSMELITNTTQPFPGRCLTTLAAINPKHTTKIVFIGSHYLAVYGADPSEEGAVLIIFNLQFGLVQCRQHFKLFSNPPRLWAIGSNLILAEHQHLKVIPFRLSAQKLSALIGSNKPSEPTKVVLSKWSKQSSEGISEKKLPNDGTVPEEVSNIIEKLTLSGFSEPLICDKVLPVLLENDHMSGLKWMFDYFSDIPETCTTKILAYCLEDLKDSGKEEIIRIILRTPVLENIKLFRNSCTFQNTVALMTVINSLKTDTEIDNNILNWACLCLDAYYQQFLLSKDEKTQTLLKDIKLLVLYELDYMESLKQLDGVIRNLCKGEALLNSSSKVFSSNKKYAVHYLKLYNPD